MLKQIKEAFYITVTLFFWSCCSIHCLSVVTFYHRHIQQVKNKENKVNNLI